jgi:hypothetical protein
MKPFRALLATQRRSVADGKAPWGSSAVTGEAKLPVGSHGDLQGNCYQGFLVAVGRRPLVALGCSNVGASCQFASCQLA